jgi:hypothetical protein
MSVGGQIFKAAMEAMSGACKGIMDMVPQSDSEDVKSYFSRTCGQMAKMVGDMYDNGTKMFPDYASEFEEPARVAAEYAALGEEPDAAMNNDEEEAELQDEEKGDTGDEDDALEKGLKIDEDAVIKVFDGWYEKIFGDRTPKELFDKLDSLKNELDEHKAKLSEHDETLADAHETLAAMLP